MVAVEEALTGKIMLAPQSLAQVYYRWDAGVGSLYATPVKIPAGARVLHYRVVDETGHRSKPVEWQVGTP
jgi:hypothetical protein